MIFTVTITPEHYSTLDAALTQTLTQQFLATPAHNLVSGGTELL